MDEAWIDTVRLARDFGDVSTLLPPGVMSLAAAPYTLVNAISDAQTFDFFARELPDDRRPPRRIWGDVEALAEFFEGVKRRDASPDASQADAPAGPQNDLARTLVVG